MIKSYVVGTCIKSYNGVYIKNRGETNYLSERAISSNIVNLVKIYIGTIVIVFIFHIVAFVDFYIVVIFLWPEKKKKKKKRKWWFIWHQQVNSGDDALPVNSGDATLSTPIQSFFLSLGFWAHTKGTQWKSFVEKLLLN